MKFSRRIRNLIADFRALPHENSHAYFRRPKSVGNIIEFALTNMTVKRKGENILLDNWYFIVGENFYKRCHPITILNNDILLIGCENSILRAELEIMKTNIFQKIISIPQCSHIRDIRFNISSVLK